MAQTTLVAPQPGSIDVSKSYEYLFTPITDSIKELKARRRDDELKNRIRKDLGYESEPLLDRLSVPTAILFRQVATPSHEVLHFIDFATEYSLRPLIIEYTGDKFVGAGNTHKRALGKMPIFQYTGSDGRDMVRYKTVIDFNSFVGKPLADVCCISGRTLVEFHHELLKYITGIEVDSLAYDASSWFAAKGGMASEYYLPFMTILLRDAILFENFHPTVQEEPLIQGIVVPAFSKVSEKYGLRPLITRLVPQHEELRPYWDMYPKRTVDFL